jgi:hypothetical protein
MRLHAWIWCGIIAVSACDNGTKDPDPDTDPVGPVETDVDSDEETDAPVETDDPVETDVPVETDEPVDTDWVAPGDTTWSTTCDFGASFGSWDVPGSAFQGELSIPWTTGSVACDDATGDEWPGYRVLDMNGDGLPDLVVTDTCEDDAVGEAYWLVFLNLGDGFDPTPINWAVPGADYDGAETFDLTTEGANCDGQATPYYLTVDLDADGAPELLLTDLCDVGGAGDVGEYHWLLYDNTGTGFATTPTEWTLPGNSFYGNETFDRPANDSDCGSDAQPAYGLADLNGDEALDLVIVDHCTVPEIGEELWRYHVNDGTGFALAPTTFELPGTAYSGSDTFDQLSGVADCDGGGGETSFGLRDMNGDGLVDLVALAVCDDDALGEDHWVVHLNVGGAGADPMVRTWDLPGSDYIGDGSFLSFEGDADCGGGGRPAHVLRDVDGDGLDDLVVTDVCPSSGDAVGEEHWLFHLNQGNAFSATAETWGLPGPAFAGDTSFPAIRADQSCSEDAPTYDAVDMTGDGILDLVVTNTCDDVVIGETFWGFMEGACAP